MRKKYKVSSSQIISYTCILLFIISGCSPTLTKKSQTQIKIVQAEQLNITDSAGVVLGCENFLQNYISLVTGIRVGLVTNPSGVNHLLQSTADLFFVHPDINLTALYCPEHGIRGAVYAGEKIKGETDPKTGLPVYSLYGKHKKPTKEMLANVDVLVFDIQDIGIRAYTYIYTMAKVMQSAAENNKQMIVLDRPNPINGLAVEGNLVHKGFFSFVGMYPIPYRHGMTIGELAQLFNREYNINCKLTVIPILNWKREMFWEDTKLPWAPTSPHVPHWKTILFMAATGTFGELGVLSEGVGYTSPFELVGSPWIDGRRLADSLNALNLSGVVFRPLYFKPYYALYKGQVCQGVQLHITDYSSFHPYITGLYIMKTIMNLYPAYDLFEDKEKLDMFNKVVGTDTIMNDLKNHIPVEDIKMKWQDELNHFKMIRKKYLIY